jgi:hypothetical protein
MFVPVDTSKVTNRRSLHFHSLDEMLADVETLAQGKIRTLGNWSAGQILEHLARTMNKSIDGFEDVPPWPIRLLGRWYFKGQMLKHGMRAGFLHRGKGAEEFVPAPTSFDEGLNAFRRAVHRQQTDTKRVASPFFGLMTNEEWEQLHCRHAELHLSFLLA